MLNLSKSKEKETETRQDFQANNDILQIQKDHTDVTVLTWRGKKDISQGNSCEKDTSTKLRFLREYNKKITKCFLFHVDTFLDNTTE